MNKYNFILNTLEFLEVNLGFLRDLASDQLEEEVLKSLGVVKDQLFHLDNSHLNSTKVFFVLNVNLITFNYFSLVEDVNNNEFFPIDSKLLFPYSDVLGFLSLAIIDYHQVKVRLFIIAKLQECFSHC